MGLPPDPERYPHFAHFGLFGNKWYNRAPIGPNRQIPFSKRTFFFLPKPEKKSSRKIKVETQVKAKAEILIYPSTPLSCRLPDFCMLLPDLVSPLLLQHHDLESVEVS